jgi:hypothetical protein
VGLASGGAVAQLGERLNGIQEVARSIRVSSTNQIKGFSKIRFVESDR